MKQWIAMVVTAGVFASPAAALPDNPWATDPVLARFRQLERDIPSLYLVNSLKLTPGQASAMVTLLDEAQKIEADMDRRLQEQAVRKTSSLEDFFTVTRSDKKPITTSMKTVKAEEGIARREARQKGDALADRLLMILDDNQKVTLAGLAPGFIPPASVTKEERQEQEAKDRALVENVLTRLRKNSRKRPKAAFEQALDVLVPYAIDKRGLVDTEDTEQRVRAELARKLTDSVGMIQDLPTEDFEQERPNLAASLVTVNKRLDEGQMRSRVIQYLINPGLMDVVRARGSMPAVTNGNYSAPIAGSIRLADREQGAATMLTLRSMQLTKGQATRLLPVLEERLAVRQKIQSDLVQAARDATPVYEALRKELAAGQSPAPSEKDARERYAAIRQLRETADTEALLEGENRVDRELSAAQVVLLSSEVQRVVRSGLAAKDSAVGDSLQLAAKCLDSVRFLKPADYEAKKTTVAGQLVADALKAAGTDESAVDLAASTKRATDVMDAARKLKDADYAAQRGDLIMDLLPRMDQGRPTLSGTKYVTGDPLPIVNFTTRALFTEDSVVALKKMLGR